MFAYLRCAMTDFSPHTSPQSEGRDCPCKVTHITSYRKTRLSCVKYMAWGEGQDVGDVGQFCGRFELLLSMRTTSCLSRDRRFLPITPCPESMIVRRITLLLFDACCFTYSKKPLLAVINNTEAM
jgi:hypothetical protein